MKDKKIIIPFLDTSSIIEEQAKEIQILKKQIEKLEDVVSVLQFELINRKINGGYYDE